MKTLIIFIHWLFFRLYQGDVKISGENKCAKAPTIVSIPIFDFGKVVPFRGSEDSETPGGIKMDKFAPQGWQQIFHLLSA